MMNGLHRWTHLTKSSDLKTFLRILTQHEFLRIFWVVESVTLRMRFLQKSWKLGNDLDQVQLKLIEMKRNKWFWDINEPRTGVDTWRHEGHISNLTIKLS